MAARSFDCVVIGSGPGGYVAAIRATQLGMSTAVVEKDAVGGRCLNYACIPAKAVLRAADILSEVREAGEFGINVSEASVDFKAVGERRAKVVATLTGGVSGLFKKNKIELIAGEASLTKDGTVRVGSDELSAKTVILATGSVPRGLPGIDFGGRIIGAEEAWALTGAAEGSRSLARAPPARRSPRPTRGSGARLPFEMLDRVLPTEDADISKLVGRGLTQGIDVHTGTPVSDLESTKTGFRSRYGEEK